MFSEGYSSPTLFVIKLSTPFLNWLYAFYPKLYLKIYFAAKYFFEKNRVEFLSTWLKEGDVAIDVGANVGFYTSLLSKFVGKKGLVYSFEPARENFKVLKHLNSKNIKMFQKAVGSSNKNIKLYKSPLHNTDHQTFDIGENREYETVECIKLDHFLPKQKNISLIKIDVQGYDYYVLLGAKKLVVNSKRIAIIGEMWPYALKRAGVEPKDYIKLIESLGLKFIDKKFKNKKLEQKINDPTYYIDFVATKL